MTTPTLTNAEKIRKLRWNTTFSGLNTVFALLTFFGPAYVLFLDELGFNKTQIGFLFSFMPFTGMVALFIAPAVARFGYKRTFVTFWGLRKVATAGFLLTPWVQAQFGHDALLAYVFFLAAAFALCRAIAETGLLPWGQEYIPNTIRGRYAAVNEIISRLIGIASTALAGYVLGLSLGLDRFMLLFAIAVVFGLLAVWSAAKIPGGAPIKKTDAGSMSHRHLLRALRDNNLLLYIAGVGILTIGTTPMASFLPLFAEQQVGLTDSQVVIALQIGSLVGGLVATYLVGWAADRYGSKPVLLSGLYIKILLPVVWMLIPRFSDWSLSAALVISAIGGAVDIAWVIGSGRLLYTRVVPHEQRSEYMAVYYAAVGLIGGISQVVGGGLLDLTQGLSGQFLIFPLDPFFPLFVLAVVLTIVSIVIFYRVKADSPVSVSEFATLFIHGNPVLAFESMFRYHRARDERAAVVMTERMGKTKSLLTVEELLEALRDPRFNVRFEAIISIARMESDPRLVEALCQILDGTEISLSVVAAWALGRMGDAKGMEALRRGLDAPYRSIQVHCARALGTLGDTTIAPLLLERLEDETDKGLQIAYASALGSLRDTRAIPIMLDVLENTTNEGARLELALALTRVIGQEHLFIRLLRQFRQDRATAVYQMVMNSKRRLALPFGEQRRFDQCAHVFSLDDFASGAAHLVEIIRSFPPDQYTPASQTILNVCANQLAASGAEHSEYLLLALHTLAVGMK